MIIMKDRSVRIDYPGQTSITATPETGQPDQDVHTNLAHRWQARGILDLGVAVRWFLVLTGVFLILLATYDSLTARRYDYTTALTGELIQKHSFGQTFVSRYPDLSTIEVRVGIYSAVDGHAPASLVLHLRDNPDALSDIATSTLPAEQIVPTNDWYRFSFPPIHDSQNRPLYFAIESPDGAPDRSVTLFWWQAESVGNPYNDGAAYKDGLRQHADLTFGLVYSPPPLTLFGVMLSDAIGHNLATSLLVLVTLVVAAAAWLFGVRRSRRTPAHRMSAALHKGSLFIVLSTGLVAGLLNMILTPPWQGPDEHTHFAYVALLERYGLDSAKVHSLDLNSDPTNLALADAVNSSMDRYNFTRLVPNRNPGSTANAGGTIWSELDQSAPYYWLCAEVLHVGRALGVAPDPYAAPAEALPWMRAVSVFLSLWVIAMAWLTGVILGGAIFPWLRLLLPLTIALLPMHDFMAGLVNNDIAAEVVCSAMFLALAALFRWPTGRRAVLWVALALASGAATSFTKDSAFTMFPLLAIALVLWFGPFVAWPLVSQWVNGRFANLDPILRSSRRFGIFPWALVFTVGLAVLAGLAALTIFRGDSTAAGWQVSNRPVVRPARVASLSAHSGQYVLELRPEGKSAAIAGQMLAPNIFHPSFDLTLSGWARSASGGGSNSKALLTVISGGNELASKEVQLDSLDEWVPISVSTTVPQGERAVTMQLTAVGSDTVVQFDDMSLEIDGPASLRADPITRYELVNPSFEQQGLGIPTIVSRVLPATVVEAADVVINPQPFRKKALWIDFADHEYRSFWGNFGWLAVPLPDEAYWLIAVVCLISLASLMVQAVRTLGRWNGLHWLALASFAGLALGVTGVFVRQTLVLSWGNYSFPQGRYLFVAIVPIAWLLIMGLHTAYNGAVRLAKRLFGQERPEPVRFFQSYSVPWGVWLLCSALVLFYIFCILGLIVPYFYS